MLKLVCLHQLRTTPALIAVLASEFSVASPQDGENYPYTNRKVMALLIKRITMARNNNRLGWNGIVSRRVQILRKHAKTACLKKWQETYLEAMNIYNHEYPAANDC